MAKQLSNNPASLDAPGYIKSVPLSDILADPGKNSRKFPPDPKKLKHLATDLIARGQLLPLLVVERNEEKTDEQPQPYDLIAGFRRFKAISMANEEGAGIETALVRVMPDLDAAQAYDTSVAENNPALREEPSLLDQAYQAVHYKEQGESGKDIAAKMGVSSSLVSQMQKIPTLRPEIQKLIHNGAIRIGIARTLPELTEPEQDALVQKVMTAKESGMTLNEIAVEARDASRRAKGKGKSKSGRKAKDEESATKKGPSIKAALNAFEDLTKEPVEVDEETGKEVVVKETKAQETRRLVFTAIHKYLGGKIGAQAMVNQIGKLI